MKIDLLQETENDKLFSKELFFQFKAQEFQYINWDSNVLDHILEIQFRAQEKSYNDIFPEAKNLIIYINDIRVGKLVINKSRSYHIIDIIIKSDYRNMGIGTQILKNLISEANKENKPVVLNVGKNNPAQKLYQKLGFKVIKEDELNLQMST